MMTESTDSIPHKPAIGLNNDHYLTWLMIVLGGYAVVGRGFAYLGVGSIYIGEITYLLGLAAIVRTGCVLAPLTSAPGVLLGAAMLWVLLHTLPFVGEYGFDALRDSVVILYGGFSFIVVALLTEEVDRLNRLISAYRKFIALFVPAASILLICVKYFRDHIPLFPGYGFPVLELRTGEAAVHLAGAAVFTLVGFRKISASWLLVLCAPLPLIALSRAATLAFFAPVVFTLLAKGQIRVLARAMAVGVVVLCAAYAVERSVSTFHEVRNSEERPLSAQQVVDNLSSIVGYGDEQTESTKTWRLDWWGIIVADTIFGDKFWTGRGFGVNLADEDGFQDGDHPDRPPLRSPHNVQMTILARGGVPGLALWGTFLFAWFSTMLGAMRKARRAGHDQWSNLFLFIACYGMSFIINGTFDVALEGPQQGIWFWCVIGVGMGTTMIYRRDSEQIERG